MLPTRPLLTRVVALPRRCVHTSGDDDAREHLRQLLRETAQTVAVVTARLPSPDCPKRVQRPYQPTYHGATLSSFTSIAFDPLPLVAFSLRVPSRMASALSAHVLPPPSPIPTPTPLSAPVPSPAAHLVINILSASQAHLAHRFARPDLHPRPFDDPDDPDDRVHYVLSGDSPPILAGTLGALSCSLVGPSVKLARLCEGGAGAIAFDDGRGHQHGRVGAGEGRGQGDREVQRASGGTGLASELFIARVLRVECVPRAEGGGHDRAGPHGLPLLYHRRRYTTVRDDTES